MAQRDTNAGELIEAGIRPQRPGERLRDVVLQRLAEAVREGGTREEALGALFPETVLEPETVETLTAALLSGSHVLLLGPPGSGKTTLAKEVWELFPKQAFVVADCPVQDDPFSLLDARFSRRVPPCPYCRHRHGGIDLQRPTAFDVATVKAKDVPVREAQLVEGHGFARVQGSPEVFPDNLTGTINLARLEEIGDPTSPLVLEPGKVLQANRGILLVDEVGKLPRGTQNVLLQALQEGIVSPAKSRETFPANLITVTTSNLRDLGNVSEPLNDRLAKVYTPFPRRAAENRRIIDIGLAAEGEQIVIPGPYRDAAVRVTMHWRNKMDGGEDLSEVGSNRTLIDILKRAQSYALITGDRHLQPDDFRRGVRDAMMGRIRARGEDSWDENRQLVMDFIDKSWRESGKEGANDYWCRFFIDELKEDKAEAMRIVQAVRAGLEKHGDDPDGLAKLVREDGGDARVRRFVKFVQTAEKTDRKGAVARMPAVFRALEDLGAFSAA